MNFSLKVEIRGQLFFTKAKFLSERKKALRNHEKFRSIFHENYPCFMTSHSLSSATYQIQKIEKTKIKIILETQKFHKIFHKNDANFENCAVFKTRNGEEEIK